MTSFLGILSLDTDFPRILGDAGNPESYPFPARIKVVANAGAPEVVSKGDVPEEMVQAFIQAAQELEAEGAQAIVSTCGFLIGLQDQIAAAVSIPVMVSALSLVPMVRVMFGLNPVGVLTADASKLRGRDLSKAFISPEHFVIEGMQSSHMFAATFLSAKGAAKPVFDPKELQRDVLEAATRLMSVHTTVKAIVLECGNLPPYRAEISKVTDVPVFSILDAAALMVGGKVPLNPAHG